MSTLPAAETSENGAREAIPAICVALVVLIPFLFSAYTIDDVTFLLQAKHALVDPLHPSAFDMVFHGDRIRLSQYLVTGPVMAYLLMPSVLLVHGEWLAHLIQIVFVILALVATTRLSLRLGLDRMQATFAALVVVVSPAVAGMTITAMPDVAAMAFAVCGVERLLVWEENRSAPTAFTAGLLLALAALSRPHMLLVFGCGALLVFLALSKPDRACKRPSMFVIGLPIVIACVALIAVVLITRDPQSGKSITTATLSRLSMMRVTFNLVCFPLACVTTFPLGFLWPLVRGQDFVALPRTCVAIVIAACLGTIGGFFAFPLWTAVLAMVLAAHGIDVLIDIVSDGVRRKDYTQLALAAWVLIALSAVFYVQLPPKDLVPSAPAMGILIARRAKFPTGGVNVPAAAIVIFGSVILSIMILRASASLGEVGREGGRLVAAEARAGTRVWADGGWGFQWYAMEAGALPLAGTPPFPNVGDVIIGGLKARIVRTYPSKEPVIRPIVFGDAGGRVETSGAGFFSNLHGLLPWVWSNDELGRIEAWRLTGAPTALRQVIR